MVQRRSFFATLLFSFFRKSQNINADDKLRLMEDATEIYKITRNGHMSTKCKYSYYVDVEYLRNLPNRKINTKYCRDS